jgi:uncharacterized protein (DUF169 family)
MDLQVKEKFLAGWNKYFAGAELPVVFYFTDHPQATELVKPPSGRRCFICDLTKARNGSNLCFNVESLGCPGGKKYLGFTQETMPNFEYFLSTGIPGKLEGERYKKTPGLVKSVVEKSPKFKALAKYLAVKRWDHLDASDTPEVVIFFATPDVLSGLFTLANFDETDPYSVITPSAAGCGTLVQYPYLENFSEHPRCVLGMFDVSARPCVPAGTFSFAAPYAKFLQMVENMDESFLITPSWDQVRKRISSQP